MALPDGVEIRTLKMHTDDRGCFTEIFRETWDSGVTPVQWNIVHSQPNVLRGVHMHPRHDDYFVLLQGKMALGLQDLRPDSPTANLACIVPLEGDCLQACVIPHGVAHGFYFYTRALHCYSVSHYFNEEDELRCHWQDPALIIPWQIDHAILSPKDVAAGNYQQFRQALLAGLQLAPLCTQPT
jgi:dTDP-4-dehydrorhamnose 3,5-epimerase